MMKTEKSEQNDGILRNSSLIGHKTKKMALTYIGSSICMAAVTAADSLIAGISIGSEALAAIAASAPFLAIAEILHCMLSFGIDKLMIRAVGKGKREEANRIFGAITFTALAVEAILYTLLLLFERPLLELLLKDQTHIEGIILYTRPLFAVQPLFEVLLCIERAFRVDGRTKLFAQRGIITNIVNIIFDILLVSKLGMDVSGLAWASVLGTAFGYTVTLSHFFSDKRTVSPDFSVIRCREELLSYVKENLRVGSSATLDEVMNTVTLATQTAVIGTIGGTEGLAIWAVFKALREIVLSISNGPSASVSAHTNLLYVQKDYDGVRFSIKKGLRIALVTSLAALLLVLAFAGGISDLYHIEPEFRTLCAQCLRIGSAVFPAVAFLTLLTAYLTAVNKIKLTNSLVLLQYGLTLVAAALCTTVVLQSFFAVYAIAMWVVALIAVVFLVRDRFWFLPEHNPEMITSYSIRLEPEQISAMSVDVAEKLSECPWPDDFRYDIDLVLEDSTNYIAHYNAGTEVHADILMKRQEDGVQIMIIDDGVAYNPLASLAEADWKTAGALEAAVILGLTDTADYDRALDLNHLALYVNPSERETKP